MTERLELSDAIDRYIDGHDEAGEAISASLAPEVRNAVRRSLAPDDPDVEDLVQDTLVALLGYLRRARVAPDNPVGFVVTIARNRCVNLAVWRRRRQAADIADVADSLPAPATHPLELVDAEQRREILQLVLDRLDSGCQDLLASIYRQEASMEELRDRLGLGSVQAVYYRRDSCLKKARKLLNRHLLEGRSLGVGRRGSVAAGQQELEVEDG